MRLKRCLVLLMMLAILLGSVPALAEYSMPYYIDVDITNQIVTVYSTKDNSVVRQMLCSAGTGNKTPLGTYYMPAKARDDERTEWYYMPNARTWVKWPSKIINAYFFHSIPFNRQSDSTMNETAAEQFGNPASHGCIRLRVEDAYYIAKNCLRGTRVRIFKSGEKNEELRSLLAASSYFAEDGISYSEFMGISKDDLGRGSTGAEVTDLQHRLHDLGYYDGGYDGIYGTELITAVKRLQKDLGLSQTGISTKSLLEVIYSADAPTSTGSTTIKESESGPVVKQLQLALQQLGIYQGDIDSIYDLEVAEAVKTFQTVCGLAPDGIAGPDTQHAVYYVLNKIQTELGESFSVSAQNEELTTGVISSRNNNILIRAKTSTDSSALGKVKHGETVTVVAVEGEWARIVSTSAAGYIYKKYLKSPGKAYNPMLVYTNQSGKSYTLGETLEKRLAGEDALKEEIRRSYSTEGFMDYLADADVTYATVDTGSDSLKLNLRMEPSTEGQVIDGIPNRASMRVLEKGDAWSKVAYNGSIGYLMSEYLSFWQGTAEDEADVIASQKNAPANAAGEAIRATVVANDDTGRAAIYAEPSSDASVLALAPKDLEVNVLSFNESTGWVQIEVNGNQGFMRDENLSFTLGAADDQV